MKQRAKKEKELKRAMIATWSDSDSSDNDEEEQMENLCYMANEDLIQEDEIECDSSDEVDYYDFLEYSKDELAKALIKCI